MAREFEGRVAIVTGAGSGLGRSHAKALAAAGANVVVNDIGVTEGSETRPSDASVQVVEEIRDAGGTAHADFADVSDYGQVDALVHRTAERWGKIDILINNAGMLRDRTFAKMDLVDFARILDVHLMGSTNFVKSVWPLMRSSQYGRIVLTTSTSGLFGNFGQANYGSAKAAMLGLMNVLHLEGAGYGIHVNCLAPTAATDMTRDLLPPEALALLEPDTVSPAILYLTAENAPSKMVMGAGAGVFSVIHVLESAGVYLPPEERNAAGIARRIEDIASLEGAAPMDNAFGQTEKFVRRALDALGKPGSAGGFQDA